MKIKLLLLVVFFLVTICVFILRIRDTTTQNSLPPAEEGGFFPETQTTTVTPLMPREGTYVRNKLGALVETNNFKNTLPPQAVYDSKNLLLAEGKNASQESLYQIFYYVPDGSIAVVLLEKPFNVARTAAEAELRTIIGLDDKNLCQLDIRVAVPAFADEDLSGKNLGLSFCPFASTL